MTLGRERPQNLFDIHRRVANGEFDIAGEEAQNLFDVHRNAKTNGEFGWVGRGGPQTYSDAHRNAKPKVRAWLLTMGFTLSYGAMFSKIWRVHKLSTKAKTDHKRKYSWKLYFMIGMLLLLDVLILSAWQIIDPLQRKMEVFPLEDPEFKEEDIKIEPQLEHCESENNAVWLGESGKPRITFPCFP
ncbi:Gamma-aminobutyric acid type B receptor subunit 1 [Araneus ventricosus]|uniref:Gamma-aminobutyric acid type B receptor subunit 1 n=1 Tax=Araneus ventricosus TaxID=182803 RepID=A0A4Y2X690_ARAVE|nr:Gamma-aminobutyric acid type B receptor subunit 1 [Araneus ventricosus]